MTTIGTATEDARREALGGPPTRRARLRSTARRWRPRTASQWLGVVLVVGWVLVAVLAPFLTPFGPIQQSPDLRQPPSPEHWFGTDQLGRDVFSRVVWGARNTLPIGVSIVLGALVIGVPLGAVAGYVGGWVDEVVMRAADIFLSFPSLVLALAIAAALGPDLTSAILAIAVVLWPRYARIVRGQVLSVKELGYVLAERGLGQTPLRILLGTVLPNVLPTVAVFALLDIGLATLAGATLSFLGLGIRPPEAEWGAMVSLGLQYPTEWWISVFPGIALISFVVGLNLYGEVLEKRLGGAPGGVR